jgi:Ca2+-dependent lipid-binding protein
MINPYVTVEVMDDKKKSQVAAKTQNPVWEESFEL